MKPGQEERGLGFGDGYGMLPGCRRDRHASGHLSHATLETDQEVKEEVRQGTLSDNVQESVTDRQSKRRRT